MVNNYDVIVIEDLNVSGMVKNRRLSKSISDASFSTFRSQLEYKTKWYGKELILADRFYASTKICSKCGTKKDSMSLSERVYKCEVCGMELDRDLNSAYNLRAIGVNVAESTRRPNKTSIDAKVDELCKNISVIV